MSKPQLRLVFVCMGNICRSPTAEGVFQRKLEERGLTDRVEIDSAGTHSYHVGSAPDARAQATALQRNYDLSVLRARKFEAQDFADFDYVLAMDRSNYEDLSRLMQGGDRGRLHLFLQFSRNFKETEVPDPYYGGDAGFEHVLDLVEDASEGLLDHLCEQHQVCA